ncbi:proliferation marker protein Ki-67 isoform X2 [Festucalex cinctus]
MPLHGKIVVVKRTGGDGTEFPLTASCLFGRKPDCDIRIQLPQVSKEHCRIDLNENKEVILTNLSTANPTRVNGEVLQQSERLKDGDVITIVDRSFRFEYPPAPTPKKCAIGSKAGTPNPQLKDGTNLHIQRSLEQAKIKDPKILASDVMTPDEDAENFNSKVSSPQTRQRVTPKKFSGSDVVEQTCAQTPKSHMRRRSKEATPAKEHDKIMSSPQNANLPRATERGAPRKRRSAELVFDSPEPQTKKKRVSFGGCLVPELFDKKLPPDSPLRKGEKPRRSLCLTKPKKSLLRRASVIGLLKEDENQAKNSESPKTYVKKSPKGRSPSSQEPSPGKETPKPRTPSPHKNLPKSTPVSSKKESPGKRTPKSASMSGEKSPNQRSSSASSEKASPRKPLPKSPKSTPAPKSPKPNTPSAKAPLSEEKSPKSESSSEETSKFSTPRRTSSSGNKLETPLTKGSTSKGEPGSVKRTSPRLSRQENANEIAVKTPQGTASVQGRFSVSLIETPSPMAEDAVIEPVQSVTATPKIPLRRKSMKSTSRKARLSKSAIQVVRRRSGISRASIKAISSWADTVKFGQAKVQAALPGIKTGRSTVTMARVAKKVVSRTQTPLKKHLGHAASTGHAESPVTIVVGRAFRQKVTRPVAAAPKVVINTAITKKNMKMDEDLSGISEMFQTPSKEGKRRSEIKNGTATKTPLVVNEPSVLDPSVLNTPEEPGEMAVSPLTLASTIKAGQYSKEAVKRLLNGSQESSFISDTSATEKTDSVEQCAELTSAVTTPTQKPQLPECLTGVKRLLKTPRQKTEPLEDLRGQILKTPKQKPEQQECLTGVKSIFTTPEQREPIEQHEKLLQTPREAQVDDVSFGGAVDHLETPAKDSQDLPTPAEEIQDRPEQTNLSPLKVNSSAVDCVSGINRVMNTPKQRHTPVEGVLGIEMLGETPKERSEAVDANFGIKRLMRSPRLRGTAPVEDFEGLQELMEEPAEFKEQPASSDLDVAKELDFTQGQSQDNGPSDVNLDAPQIDITQAATAEVSVELPSDACETSEAMQAVSQAVIEDADTASMESTNSKKPVRGRRAKAAKPVTEESSQDPVVSAPVRGRRGKKAEPTEPSDEEAKADPKPKRGRCTKNTRVLVDLPEPGKALDAEQPQLPAVTIKKGRGRKVISETIELQELEKDQVTSEKTKYQSKPLGRATRGRNAKHIKELENNDTTSIVAPPGLQELSKASKSCRKDDPTDVENLVTVEVEAPPVSEPEKANNAAASAIAKTRRGLRKPKQAEVTPDYTAIQDGPIETPTEIPKRSRRAKQAEGVATAEVSEEKSEPEQRQTRGRGMKTTSKDETKQAIPAKKKRRGAASACEESNEVPVPESAPASVEPVKRGRRPVTKSSTNVSELNKKQVNATGDSNTTVQEPQNPQRSVKWNLEVEVYEIPKRPARAGRGKKLSPDCHTGTPSPSESVNVAETEEEFLEKAVELQPAKRARRGVKVAKEVESTSKVDTKRAEDMEAQPKNRSGRSAKLEVHVHEIPKRSMKAVRGNRSSPDGHTGTPSPSESENVAKTEEDFSEKVVEPQAPKRARRGVKVAKEAESTSKVDTKSAEDTETQPKNTRGRSAKLEVEVHEIPKKSVRVVRGKRLNPGDHTGTPSPSDSENVAKTEKDFSEKVVEPQAPKRARRGVRVAKEAESTSKVDTKSTEDTEAQPKTDNLEVEVHDIPKRSVRAVRGKKLSPGGHTATPSSSESDNVAKTEEDFSGKVVERQPAKTARRGAKVANEAVSISKVDTKNAEETETQPKIRRGRSAKK